MNGSDPKELASLDWVLIFAPYRKDASYTVSLLEEHDIRGQAATGAGLAEMLAESPGAIVVTHEALNADVIATIAKFLRDQPNWSETPIIVLVDRAASSARIQAALSVAWPRSRQTFYQRPVAALALISGVQAALLTRFRQRELRDYLERERELRLELNHRVKNILASVISIFEMTRRGTATIEDLSNDFRGRLTALSNVHSTVFLAGGEEVSLGAAVNSTLAPYRSDNASGIHIDGPEVLVSRNAATTLALCLHELATNAIKYGALSQPNGHVLLKWELSSDADPLLMISWIEIGGPPVVEPSRVGYGTRYIRSALNGLFGESPKLIFAPHGLRCSIHGLVSRLCPKQ
ncbi:two-component sensor histidine kinase [Nitrobacter vulgaris]|uniref:sensor histidine kinase n=1 Tax=Nitrobacter vulgaris TaxID=29421 RepID=UPI0028541EDA|nr:sensor histidine kinase [Nitrobacter vulgaris]MDR6306061.1 two-component sensor histidine kinase [Nitrobacter vulgaris]